MVFPASFTTPPVFTVTEAAVTVAPSVNRPLVPALTVNAPIVHAPPVLVTPVVTSLLVIVTPPKVSPPELTVWLDAPLNVTVPTLLSVPRFVRSRLDPPKVQPLVPILKDFVPPLPTENDPVCVRLPASVSAVVPPVLPSWMSAKLWPFGVKVGLAPVNSTRLAPAVKCDRFQSPPTVIRWLAVTEEASIVPAPDTAPPTESAVAASASFSVPAVRVKVPVVLTAAPAVHVPPLPLKTRFV